jgi:hypothetical protein
MEILTYIAIAVIVGVLFLWFRGSRPESKINHFDNKAESFLANFKSTRHVLYDSEALPEEVSLMEEFYIRLKEHFRHEPSQIAKCSEDRMHYLVDKISEDLNFRLILDSESDAEGAERTEKAREAIAKAEEIENRFAQYLGSEAQKRLSDLREKQQEKAAKFWSDDEDCATLSDFD